MLRPGVPKCPVIAVRRMMWPFFFAPKMGRVLLMMLTGPKKLVL